MDDGSGNLRYRPGADTPVGGPDPQSPLRRFLAVAPPRIVSALGAAHAVRLDAVPDGDTGADVSWFAVPASLSRAVDSRLRGYLAGRLCAARALSAMAPAQPVPLEPLSSTAFGAPVWPAGVVGSITHSARFAAAVVAPSTRFRGVGIDCERILDDAGAEEIAARVIPEADGVVRRGAADVQLPWPVFVTAAFCAKESVYKCLHPMTGLFFEFDAVRLEWVAPARGEMGLVVSHDLGSGIGPGTLLTARFCVVEDHLYSAVSFPSEAG